MSFRTRLLVTFLVVVLLPMGALALLIRNEMTSRLTAQYEDRVESLITVIEEDLSQEGEKISSALSILRTAVIDDNRLRRVVVEGDESDRRYLLDYAADAMRMTGLSMLQIQDEDGRIVSSGHFRNEYDRIEPHLPRLLTSTTDGIALVQARAPDAPFLALARASSIRIGTRPYTIVAGIRVESLFLARLAREADLTVELLYPGGTLTSADARRGGDMDTGELESGAAEDAMGSILKELSVPFIDSDRGRITRARFHVSHELGELHALRSSVDRWFLIVVAVTAVLAVLVVSWLASRISRPLTELADKTSRVDLDRLDIDFESRSKDEIGALSRMLGAMTKRLRASAGLIRDAERRATLGELARQVNHDIKNGLTPIRNVLSHVFQLARDNPTELRDVLQERQGTLDSSMTYLENLASNYARLSPRRERQPCDINEIVRRVVANLQGTDGADLRTELGDGAVVAGDPVSLRRVIENLVDNAIDSLRSRAGSVTITTSASGSEGARRVRLVVTDTGVGMSETQRAKVFDDFYTTKEDGTGLGLSIVRRLVMDLDGSIDVESTEGKGSRFTIDMPGTHASKQAP